MKRLLTLVLVIILAATASVWGQSSGATTNESFATQLEAFLARRGTLVIKEFYDLGTITGLYGAEVNFVAVVIYEPGREAQRVKGLKIESTSGGRYEKSETCFLDEEELRDLSAAIQYMLDLAAEWQTDSREYTEVIYTTEGNFNIGFFQRGTEQTGFASCGSISRAICFFGQLQDLNRVKNLIGEAQELLAGK